MTSNEKRLRKLDKSQFEYELTIPWEHAFNKFGFGDGEYCLTDSIALFLENHGYDVTVNQWGIHNEIITSIKKDGRELMPDEKSGICIGYSDPREYLPIEIIQLLDEHFYD